MKNILEIKNLKINIKSNLGQIQAVREVNLDLKEEEILAIVGESGSGKSILSKSIARLLPRNAHVESGNIIFNNKNILSISEKEIRRLRGKEIGIIFQNPMTSLNPTATIGNQIIETIMTHEKISKKEAKIRAIELLKTLGIDNPPLRFNQYPYEISGGMKQRVAISIGICCNPKLLIADEITTALDVITQAEILSILKMIRDKKNTSIIVISHDLTFISSISDRIAVMYAGKIVEIGKKDEIIYDAKHPYTKALINSLPHTENNKEYLYSIPGKPPNLFNPPKGDAFAIRNKMALRIDYNMEPPMFKISKTHFAATWLLYSKKKGEGNGSHSKCE